MANLRDLRRRRKSVANTKKITRTMELVASAKMKKAADAASASRPYADGLRELVSALSSAAGQAAQHPLMVTRSKIKTVAIYVCTSDRGLCGAFNANLVAKAVERAKFHRANGCAVEFIALGKKAASSLAFNGSPASAVHSGIMDAPKYPQAQKLAEAAMERFIAGGVDLAEVVYARFISAVRQVPDYLTLLPVGGGSQPAAGKAAVSDFIYHPSAAKILASLIPQTVKTALFSALLQTSAAEHSARRIAMKNASDAAGDMAKSLATAYNRGRQGKITQEIAEIVGAVEAMA